MARRKAFTLVELLVVIAIIAVLLAILMPSLQTAKQLAKRLQCAKKLAGIGRGISMYVEHFDGSLPLLEKYDVDTPYIESTYLLTRTNPRPTQFVHLGGLFGSGLVDDGKVFYCPAVEGWYGDPEHPGNNNGTYNGAVAPVTFKFIDIRSGAGFTPSQGWKATLGYCYWPLSKKIVKPGDTLPGSSDKPSRYNVGLPYNATKVKDLMMTRPIVTDNKFHSTKMSGWMVDCLFPDGHVAYQKQPKMDGLNGYGVQGKWGMYSDQENRQFADDLMNINATPVRVSDPAEMHTNLQQAVTPTQFSYALEQ